jgi:hypothetical protein
MAITEKDIVKQAIEAAQRIFTGVPQLKVELEPINVSVGRARLDRPADFTLSLSNSNYRYSLAVNVKAQGYPQQLTEAIDQLIKYRYRTKRHDELVVAAPFITAEGAAICREDEVNYFDFAGNCRIALNGLYIERTGVPNPFQPKIPGMPSLYGTRAERVLRLMLHDPSQAWKVVPLATRAAVSLGTVSNVRKQLVERDWAHEATDGLRLTQPKQLLKDWAAVWGRRRAKPTAYFTKLPIPELEKRIADFAAKQKIPFALTGTAGAWHRAPMTRYQRTQFYWGGMPDALAEFFELKPVESGANVHAFLARDAGVYDFVENIKGVPVVGPVQLYLDLQRDPARGQEAADHLWNTVLFPQDG